MYLYFPIREWRQVNEYLELGGPLVKKVRFPFSKMPYLKAIRWRTVEEGRSCSGLLCAHGCIP